MTKRAVLLIAIVGVLCLGLLGHLKPVQAASSMIGVAQTPPTEVWVDLNEAESGTNFWTIQAAVNAVAPGGTIRVNGGNYGNLITIDKSLTILGFGAETEAPLINGQIVLASQANPTGLLKLYNLRFGVANGVIIIGGAPGAVFGRVELNQLTFGTTPVANSRAIQTASSVQIKELKVLNCVINAAHGIELNGDIGSAVISNNIFNLTGLGAGRFDAITINQNPKASASINPSGTLTIQGNTLNKPTGELYPYGSAILNQADFTMTSTADGKKLTVSKNTLVSGSTTIRDQTLFIQDKIADFVLVNVAPTMTPIAAQSVNEGEPLSFTAIATDTDVPVQMLTFSLANAPAGADIDAATGVITWTPTEDQGPQVYNVGVCVSDGIVGIPTCQTVMVTVNEVNLEPTLIEILAKTVKEGELLTFTISGSDGDLPAQVLTFNLADAPAGATIDAAMGVLTWTPAEGQGAQAYTLSVCVSDGASTTCRDLTITVESVNSAPTMAAIAVQSVNEGEQQSFTAAATDTDLPTQTLSYSFSGNVPAGMQIDAAIGEVTWTPSEAQGGNDYVVTVCASDGTMNVCQVVSITVNKMDSAPQVDGVPEQVARVGALLTFTVRASDADLPEQTLTYSLQDAPAGAGIDPETGVFTWAPGGGQGHQEYALKVCVSDGTLSTCQNVTITVERVNSVPALAAIAAQSVNEGEPLSFTALATDSDLPAQTLTYNFMGDAPAGMQISAATGVITWTATEDQGPQVYNVGVCVSDGVVAIPTCQTVMVTVNEVNVAPTLAEIPIKVVNEGELLTFTASGSDGDLPTQTLTYGLSGNVPPEMQIDATTGEVTWTPSEAQGGDDYIVTVCVSDGVVLAPTCMDVVVTVLKINSAPALTEILGKIIKEGELLTFKASGSDGDLPAQTLTYSLSGNVPPEMKINAAIGEVTWTPSEGQGGNNYLVTVCVSDGASTTCQDLTITVEEVNSAPTIAAIAAQSVNEEEQLSFTALAKDTDLPAQTLSYSFSDDVPAGMQINTSTGEVTWTPTEAQGGNDYIATVCASDSVVLAPTCIDVVVTVLKVNSAPALTEILAKIIKEGKLLTFTASGSDEDLPMQTLTYSLSGNVPPEMQIDATIGEVTWTPSEAQGGNIYIVTVCVSDVASTTCQDLTITVEEVNSAPTIAAIAAQSVNEEEQLSFTGVGMDTDLPAQTLAYNLLGDVPDGMQINATTGEVTWTPNEAQGGYDYTVTICIGDGASTTCQAVSITVNKTDSAPQVDEVPEQSPQVGALLTFAVRASDADLPAQTLIYSLQDAPAGAGIDPETGVFTWVPGVGQGPQDYTLKVCVGDSTLTTCQDVTIRVAGVPTQALIKLYLPIISR